MHACIAINALVNILFEENKSINWVLLQTTKGIPSLTIYLGWWEFWIEPYKPERREYSGFLFLSISTILYCVRVIQEWNDGCFSRLTYYVIWLLLSGPYTYSPYVYATVTCTHGPKNARDALMHACPSTWRNTHGDAQVLNLHVHAHTYSARVS